MTPNYRFILNQITVRCGPSAKVLDFGCGGGQLVELGRRDGLNMIGADPFTGYPEMIDNHRASGRLGKVIFIMVDRRLPFADASFDAVIANQVLEHVHDLDLALSEVSRVLRPGGILLSLNPTLAVLREGHCGVPLVQLLHRVPRLQHAYLLLARCAGVGMWKAGKGRREWAAHFADYMQTCTAYRSASELIAKQARMIGQVTRLEPALASYRLGDRTLGRRAQLRWIAPIVRIAVTCLGNIVTVAHKPLHHSNHKRGAIAV